jgi:hypothetical protein
MKSRIIFKAFYALAISMGLFLQSCTKHEDDKNPCDHPVVATATNFDMYDYGHFMYGEFSSNDQFAPSQTFLKVVNWVDYADKVIPGRKYKIGYVEVPCNTEKNVGRCGNEFTCGFPILKCVKIMCLEEVREQQEEEFNDCFNSQVGESDFEELRSSINEFIQIDNHTINAKMYFSGCSYEDPVRYTMYFRPTGTYTNDGMPIVDVKIKEHDRGIVCQAVFEREFCFDLNNMKNYFISKQTEATHLYLKVHLSNNQVVDVIYDMGL